VIACSPKIVISPTPNSGLPTNASASTSPDNPFSAALQAATQNLLHPSLKPRMGVAIPTQKASSTQNVKTGSTSGNPSLQNPTQGAMSPVPGNNPLPVQGLLLPAASLVPSVALPQPATIDEAKLQATTLGAEQKQSATQTANIGTAAASTQAIPSAPTGFQQFVLPSPQFGPVTAGITGVSTNLLPSSQTALLSLPLPEPSAANDKSTTSNPTQPFQQRPLAGLDLLSAAEKKEPAPVPAQAPNAASGVNQPGLPAHTTRLSTQPVPATAQPAANATLPTNDTRSVPNPPGHSGFATEPKNQTAEAAGISAAAASAVPQIPLQSVVPDINVIKVSPKPAEAMQTPPGLAASPAANAAQPAMDVSKKNGDASGNGNAQSGAGKGSTSSSFAPAAADSQTADNSAMSATKAGDVSASAVPVGTQVAHAASSANDAPGATAKTDGHAAAALQSPVPGTTEADARIQAAATYANSLLHSARLVERVGQTELRVGIQTGEFGNVDIRTSMGRNQFTAQISVERGELGKVLAAELPNLQNKLSEQRLPMANITLHNQSSGGSAGFGQGSRQSQTMQKIAIPQSSEGELAPVLLGLTEASASTGRLDVHM